MINLLLHTRLAPKHLLFAVDVESDWFNCCLIFTCSNACLTLPPSVCRAHAQVSGMEGGTMDASKPACSNSTCKAAACQSPPLPSPQDAHLAQATGPCYHPSHQSSTSTCLAQGRAQSCNGHHAHHHSQQQQKQQQQDSQEQVLPPQHQQQEQQQQQQQQQEESSSSHQPSRNVQHQQPELPPSAIDPQGHRTHARFSTFGTLLRSKVWTRPRGGIGQGSLTSCALLGMTVLSLRERCVCIPTPCKLVSWTAYV
jgi:hypothetical protein